MVKAPVMAPLANLPPPISSTVPLSMEFAATSPTFPKDSRLLSMKLPPKDDVAPRSFGRWKWPAKGR